MVKNNKEKVFELKIQEDDDLSGIDSISLVDEPAIEVNWVSFKKETEHTFEKDEIYVQHLMNKGESEEDLLNDGWVINKVEILDGKDSFIETSTDPNAPSFEDEKEYKVRYKYILNPQASGPAIIPTSRPFCRQVMAQNRVWRVEDIDGAINDFDESPLVWRGSFNCRHVWSRVLYTKDATIINKASVNKGKVEVDGFPNDLTPDPRVMGYPEPDTRVKANPSFSKEYFAGQKVSIDYDDTLSTEKGKLLARRLLNEGKDLHIVTRRQESASGPVYNVADQLGIPHSKVHFTNGKLKWETIQRLGISKHIDNNPDELKAIKEHLPYVQTEQFGYDVGTIGGYVDPGIGKKKKMSHEFEYLVPNQFESHSDYPESVKNNAKAVLKYVDENGWGSCGTEVGKIRANQLANGEAISLDTIKRMYSYLSRHEVDLESSKGYGDGCGKLMYDSWGGKSALSWAKSKINQAENMSKQYFASDNEKHIVLGPAMIPDQKIFRKDALGNPYYVFFTPETIKMIAEKYMRNKYTDNNDLMHDGTAIKDIHVLESWIKESNNDKSSDYGFENLPVGTWFVSMKVNNPNVWSQVKEGKLNGFSVSGYFEEVSKFTKEEMFLYKVAEILKNIKD
jgi:hypothetical protein